MDQQGADALRFVGDDSGSDGVHRMDEVRLRFRAVDVRVAGGIHDHVRPDRAYRIAYRVPPRGGWECSRPPAAFPPAAANMRASRHPTWPVFPDSRIFTRDAPSMSYRG